MAVTQYVKEAILKASVFKSQLLNPTEKNKKKKHGGSANHQFTWGIKIWRTGKLTE